MDTALIEEFEEWSLATGRLLGRIAAEAWTREELAVASWSMLIESFSTHRRMWTGVVSGFLCAGDPGAVARRLGIGVALGHRGLAAILADLTEGLFDDGESAVFDPIPSALLVGVAVQHLTDPAHAPSACDVVETIQTWRAECCDPLHKAAAARYDAVLI